jgi:HlyD family secretion protein
MKKVIVLIVILAIAGAGFWFFRKESHKDAPPLFTFVEVSRGALNNSVLSTGTLFPVVSVDVGTQVSGKIEHIFADFNDRVLVGQVLAVLDTTLLVTSVHDAESAILKTKAQYNAAKNEYERNKKMYERAYISEFDLISFQSKMESSLADVHTAESALQRAKTNLGYAVIRSPLHGTIIYRNVEAGQTVAASFSTPTLFTIAEDLAKMEIHALVDESDIGKITRNQEVSFTVEAYIDKTFSGTVRQIRLQPQTVQNVVNYTVVIDAPNKDNLLIPGMTATVNFISMGVPGMLLVPNAALQFKPAQQIRDTFQKKTASNRTPRPDSTAMGRKGQATGGAGSGAPGRQPVLINAVSNTGKLWYLDDKGMLAMATVKTGDTDGRMTVIFPGKNIREGMKIISGLAAQKSQAAASSAIPMRRMF